MKKKFSTIFMCLMSISCLRAEESKSQIGSTDQVNLQPVSFEQSQQNSLSCDKKEVTSSGYKEVQPQSVEKISFGKKITDKYSLVMKKINGNFYYRWIYRTALAAGAFWALCKLYNKVMEEEGDE